MRSIHIVSPSAGSIGEVTKDLLLGLSGFFYVSLEGMDDPKELDILLSHFFNPSILDTPEFNSFKTRVLIQPIDGTVLTKKTVEGINKYDIIITPANAGKKIMIENGVVKPIHVIPNFYKERSIKYSDDSLKQIPIEPFMFYHESTFHARKGSEFLYEGFIKAFSDNEYTDRVLLVCKDNPFNKVTFDRVEKLKRDAMKLQSTYKKPANIIKISQHLDWPKMNMLWDRTDAYVSFAKIEGFGIPLLRMAHMEKQILTLDAPCNGCLDFLNHTNSTLISTTMIKAENEHMTLYTKDTQWAVPKMDDVVSGFRMVADKLITGTKANFNKEEINKFEFSNVVLQYKELFENL